MKRLLFWAFAAFMFAACTEIINEQDLQPIVDDAPESLTVGFEENYTRVQLNEATKTVWTKDDLVSVFYRSNANQKWQYQGETGERVGNLKRVDAGTATRDMDRVVVVYPYNEDYYINPSTFNVQATLPATQTYLKDTYGVGCNLMVSQSEFTQSALKSVCGWLKLQLTGNGEVVKSIKLCGNKDEQVAGLIYVDTDTAESTLALEMGNNGGGNLIFDDTIITQVTLDCGEGVTLGAEATAFYIALPPQTFTDGFTVEVNCEGYKLMTISTSKKVVIERNHIQPMAVVKHEAKQELGPRNNEIWYTNDSTTEETTPFYPDHFDANIVSNLYDTEKDCWVITFDSDLTKIGDDAFGWCSSLTSLTIPDSVTEIGSEAFSGCSSLTNVTIGSGVTKIGKWAFSNCSSLTRVTIPDGVTSIRDYTFAWCSSLTNVTIGSGVIEIGVQAFDGCSSLTNVTIGSGVTKIGKWAFSNCSSLTRVTIPDNVTEIGRQAFENCSSLTSVTIGSRVTKIEEAFYGCSSLTTFYGKFASADNRCLIIDGVLNSFASAGLTEYTIPDNVTEIGKSAFAHCSLTSVTIPDSVTKIGECAFGWCYDSLNIVTIGSRVTEIGNQAFFCCRSLTSVTIPDSVTKIGGAAFEQCNSLTSVTIPDSVTEIGQSAFERCSSLTSVTIGSGVNKIGDWAFAWCGNLTSVYCKPTTPPSSGDDMFSYSPKLYVPTASVEAYKSASGWSDYAYYIEGYNF